MGMTPMRVCRFQDCKVPLYSGKGPYSKYFISLRNRAMLASAASVSNFDIIIYRRRVLSGAFVFYS